MAVINIVGDFVFSGRIEKNMHDPDYDEHFSSVIDIFNQADINILNLESPIVSNGLYIPLDKCGPNLQSHKKCITLLKKFGINLVTLANNHIYDYCDNGIINTVNELSLNKINYIGIGNNIGEAKKIFKQTISGVKISFINCCEKEFSIATKKHGGANPLDIIDISRDIINNRNTSDYIILIIHGGIEHYKYPSPHMKKTYQYFIDCGADIIVNHHQHCFSGYEEYKHGKIFYGLGNFCFDNNSMKRSSWNEGLLLQLTLTNTISFKLFPIIQNTEVYGVYLDKSINAFENINHINNIISNDTILQKKYEDFLNSSRKEYNIALVPFSNRIVNSLAYRNIFPHLFSKDKLLFLKDMLTCDSHRERFLDYIIHQIQLRK